MDIFWGVAGVILGLAAYLMLYASGHDLYKERRGVSLIVLVISLAALAGGIYICLFHWNMWTMWALITIAIALIEFLYTWRRRDGDVYISGYYVFIYLLLAVTTWLISFGIWWVTTDFGSEIQEEVESYDLVKVDDDEHPEALAYIEPANRNHNGDYFVFYYRKDGEVVCQKTTYVSINAFKDQQSTNVHILENEREKAHVVVTTKHRDCVDGVNGEPFTQEVGYGGKATFYELYVHSGEVAQVENLDEYVDRHL